MELLGNNFEFEYGRHIKSKSSKDNETVWTEITTTLNGLGITKSVKGWKKSFQDIRGGVKEKLTLHQQRLKETGGNSQPKIKFSELDKRIIRIFNINGNPPEITDASSLANLLPVSNQSTASSSLSLTENHAIEMNHSPSATFLNATGAATTISRTTSRSIPAVLASSNISLATKGRTIFTTTKTSSKIKQRIKMKRFSLVEFAKESVRLQRKSLSNQRKIISNKKSMINLLKQLNGSF